MKCHTSRPPKQTWNPGSQSLTNLDCSETAGGYLQLCRPWWLAPKAEILFEPPLVQRSGLKWAKEPAQLGRAILELCHNTFNSGTCANDEQLRWLPRQDGPSVHGGWRRTWNKCHWPWNVTSTVHQQWEKIILKTSKTNLEPWKPDLPRHRSASLWEDRWPPIFPLRKLVCTAKPLFRTTLDHGGWLPKL